jgi:uncharacterized membrane protein YvlD (DUF360 family)
MKKIVNIFAIEVASLFIATQIASGIVFQNGLEGLFVAGVALAIAAYFVRPVVNILLLPLNLVTLGLFKFIGHAVTLFIVDLALNQFLIAVLLTETHAGLAARPQVRAMFQIM